MRKNEKNGRDMYTYSKFFFNFVTQCLSKFERLTNRNIQNKKKIKVIRTHLLGTTSETVHITC